MIHRLRQRFILLSMTLIFVLLAVIITSMNIINYQAVVAEADEILTLLAQNKGSFPEFKPDKHGRYPMGMSPETPYESRYFSVLLHSDGGVIHTDTGKIASIDSEKAVEYATEAIRLEDKVGFIGNYRYMHQSEPEIERIVFLDCGRRMDAFHTFLETSIYMASVGFLIVFILITVVSGKIVSPIAESYEKQKKFITDAGHELKTPLTIINANMDILEADPGNEECMTDIRQQTSRLRSLTNDLVMLSRMEETETPLPKIDFPLSEIAADTVRSYETLAANQGKNFTHRIEPMLTLNGNDKSVERLITILLDNAFKYSPANGEIRFELNKQAKTVIITVYNTTVSLIERSQLEHVFDRFYRTDHSRNSETGGHGIGLSIAKAIVLAHNGKINAWTEDGNSFGVTVSLPTI